MSDKEGREFWLEILKKEVENLGLPDIKTALAFIRGMEKEDCRS